MGVEADWDQQAPDVQSELHQAPLRSCLPQKEPETFPSSGTTRTHHWLGWGKKRHILVCVNDPEARNEPPKCWLMERGTIKLLSKSFNALYVFYLETGLERAGQGGKRSQGAQGNLEQGN